MNIGNVHASSFRPSGDPARHNVSLAALAVDPDVRFRPSAELVDLLQHGGRYVWNSMDRPIVPLANAMVQGLVGHPKTRLQPRASCADGYVLLSGSGLRQTAALRAVIEHAPWSYLNWYTGGYYDDESSIAWIGEHGELGEIASPGVADAAMLAAAEAFHSGYGRQLAVAHPEPGFLAEVRGQLMAAERLGGPPMTMPPPAWAGFPFERRPYPRRLALENDGGAWRLRADPPMGVNESPALDLTATSLMALQTKARTAIEQIMRRRPGLETTA